jgi:hypothetical protein
MHLIQQHQPQNLAEAGDGVPPVESVGLGRLGRLDDQQCHSDAQPILGGTQGQVDRLSYTHLHVENDLPLFPQTVYNRRMDIISQLQGVEFEWEEEKARSNIANHGVTFEAIAQKSPCEGIRVIMGKEAPLKLSQREPDAREEVPMRTPKRLDAEARIIYHPALLTCLHCGDLLVAWNSLAWDKTVQTLDGLLSVATRPGHCPHVTCPGSRLRLYSAAAQCLAPLGSTSGYDVLVRLGWLRQSQHATSREIHTELAARFPISESPVRALSQHVY